MVGGSSTIFQYFRYESAGKYEDLEMLYKALGKFSFNSQGKVEYVVIKIDETVLEKQ